MGDRDLEKGGPVAFNDFTANYDDSKSLVRVDDSSECSTTLTIISCAHLDREQSRRHRRDRSVADPTSSDEASGGGGGRTGGVQNNQERNRAVASADPTSSSSEEVSSDGDDAGTTTGTTRVRRGRRMSLPAGVERQISDPKKKKKSHPPVLAVGGNAAVERVGTSCTARCSLASSSAEASSATPTSSNTNLTSSKKSSTAGERIEALLASNAFRFALRISVALTLSSLFVLIPGYPSGTWVYITSLMVSWFPQLDAASVVKKTIHRVEGTIGGAILGLSVGYSSGLIDKTAHAGRAVEATYLGVMIATVTFLYTYAFVALGCIKTHSYAGVVGLMTFAIAYEPFYTDGSSDSWFKAVLRCCNVVIGCLVGGVASLIVFPTSTEALIRTKLRSQIELAGHTSEAVMDFSVSVLEGRTKPSFFGSLVTVPREGEDDEADVAAYAAYNGAIKEWKDAKALFPMLSYDILGPISRLKRKRRNDKTDRFSRDASIILARSFRLQTTAVLLHSVVRNDRDIDFEEDLIDVFRNIGHLIGKILTIPLHRDVEDYANELLCQLETIRRHAVEEASAVSEAEREVQTSRGHNRTLTRDALRLRLAAGSDPMPLVVHSGDNSCLFFLQLVEHLALRALRLFYASRHLIDDLSRH